MKYAAMAAALLIAFSFNCKKSGEGDHGADTVLAKKYARYRVAVNKEPELKTWLATLEKGEDVDLLKEETIVTKKKATLGISKVKLAGGEEGYIESRHLADKTIVFTEDTPSFIRPTMGSTMYVKIPRGTIAFVVGEQANWVKVYAGKIEDKWVTAQWVQGGYTSDPQLLLAARLYESAVDLASSKKESDRKNGLQKLTEISEGATIFADMARAKLAGNAKEDQAPDEKKEEAAGDAAGLEKGAAQGQ